MQKSGRWFQPLVPLLISFSFFLFSQQLHPVPCSNWAPSKRGTVILSHNLFYQWLLDFFRPRTHFGFTLKFENNISVVSDSVWPHRQQPTRLPCPWDSPGKNTGVGCIFCFSSSLGKPFWPISCSKETVHCCRSQPMCFQFQFLLAWQFSLGTSLNLTGLPVSF